MPKSTKQRPPLSVEPLPEYVTFPEAAAWLAVSKTTLSRYVRSLPGFPQPFRPLGAKVRRFRIEELREFFAQCEQAEQ